MSYQTDLKNIAAKLPKPTGYRILVAAAKMEEKKGSVILPDEYRSLENTASIVGNVIAVGPDAYRDEKKFPTGAWCKVGDWILYKSYSGTRLRVGEVELRLLSDDQVDAVIDDPRLIERI